MAHTLANEKGAGCWLAASNVLHSHLPMLGSPPVSVYWGPWEDTGSCQLFNLGQVLAVGGNPPLGHGPGDPHLGTQVGHSPARAPASFTRQTGAHASHTPGLPFSPFHRSRHTLFPGVLETTRHKARQCTR